MRKLLLVVLLLVTRVAAQNVSRYDNIAFGTLPGGNVLQALPNAMITVQGCASMSTSCTLPANLCSGITDTGCGLPGLVYGDSGGNFHFYARAGRYQVSITAPGYQTRTINDVILPISASDGGGAGTNVTVNGTAAVPNQLNFTNTLLPPSGSTVVNFLLNGNTVGAYVTGTTGGGGTGFTVNGVTPTGIVNFNASTPLPPPNGINVNWTLVGTSLTAAIVGDGNANSCLLGTGIFAQCPGGGGGATLPTIPVWNLFASTGSGGAQDSGVAAEAGFVRAQVVEASGATGTAPAGFTPPNASLEYFPSGATYGTPAVTVGTANGAAIHFSHSSVSGQSGNGGIALAGGNSSGVGTSYQIYLDCEQSTGCDFKVPVSHNGSALGGGGTGTITGATTGGGLLVSGTTLGMLNTCSANQILQWNGTVWGCASNIAGTTVQVSGVGMGALANFTTGTAPTNGRSISFASSGTSVTAALVGDGTSNCLSGTGAYVVCGNPAPIANQTTGVFTNQTSATLTSTTTNLVWACWDTSTPANAIYPSNVTVSAAYLVTFNFAVPQTGQCVVNSSGGTGGGAGTITGATPNGGLAVSGTTMGLISCGSNQILQYSGSAWACINTPTGAGSGTVNSGTLGHFTWYAATGTAVSSNANLDDSVTTPATITSQETIAAPGINVTGSGGIAMTGAGGTLPTPVASQGGIGIGPGNVPQYYSNGGPWTAIGGGTSSSTPTCMLVSDLLTFTARTTVCTLALPAGNAKQWIVNCNLIWNRQNDGTTASTITARLNLTTAPTSLSYFTTETWASGGPVFGNIQVAAAAGDTQFVAPSSANGDLTIWSFVFHGTIMAPATGETAAFSMQSSNGTGAVRLGSYCTAQ